MSEYIKQYFTIEEIPTKFKKKLLNKKLIKLEGLLVNLKKEGKWIEGNFDCDEDYYYYYYEEINYIDDNKNGEYKRYNFDFEETYEIGNYKNGLKEGEFIHYKKFENYYKIYKIENYINNKKEGKCIEYNEYSNIYSKYYYLNDLKEGKDIKYDLDGYTNSIDESITTLNYVNNKIEGKNIVDWYNKNLKIIYNYINNIRVGTQYK
jgi:hypothetical protein